MRNKLTESATFLDLLPSGIPEALEARLVSRSGELFDRFMEVRKLADHDLASLPNYPWGCCETITRRVRAIALQQPWMKEWTDAGLQLRRIYGMLKDLYFQNALQLGPLYIDPANDTVDVNKTPVEILQAKEVPWVNLGDLSEYRRVARRYLNLSLYPNLHLPVLFPFMPFIAIDSEGHVFPLRHQDVILWKDTDADFRISDQWLASLSPGDRLPPAAESVLETAVAHADFPLEWTSCDPGFIRRSVLPDFRGHLSHADPAQLMKTALKLRDRACRQLHRHPAKLPGPELARLQDENLAPLPRDIHDLSWTRIH
ncbi:MAG TPA: hypothetical protein VM511_02270 [Luteolibacter sp.]|nr:hypothetical protein [Luteolibacter sp.]